MSVRPQPLLVCDDVEATSRWYQKLLGATSAHGGREYERLEIDGKLIMQLHAWDVDHEHGNMGDPKLPRGNGVLVWLETDDFDGCVARATELRADVVLPPHRNPADGNGGPNHREIWLRDPNGYTVVVCSPDGEAAQ